MRKIICFILCLGLLLSFTSCSSLKVTEEIQTAIDLYTEAVKKSENRQSGNINVVSVAEDSAIEFKTTESVINCDFTVSNGKVIYERTDTLNGVESAKYTCDGETVKSFNYDTEVWEDKTEQNANFIDASTNPLVTLYLFRVDSNYKIRTDYMTDIKSYEEDGLTAVEFTLKDSTVSDVLQYYKADGIVRQSAGHTRTYYINGEGYIEKIVVSTVQLLYSNGKEGSYKTEMTVLCK